LGCGLGFLLPMVGATRSDLLPHSSCRIRILMGLALMLTSENNRVVDVAIVGGGPAGLTASLYLARFLRSVAVLDAGDARAALIPMSRNCPGFPVGIGGGEMLRRLKHQAAEHGAEIVHATVETIEVRDGAFALCMASGSVEALFVILATGIVDKVPAIVGLREGIAAGSIGLCPVCDGYEATGKKIGVVGQEEDALKEALFLRTYSSHVCWPIPPETLGKRFASRRPTPELRFGTRLLT
jgi:thioredoxin reductase (NADPH)